MQPEQISTGQRRRHWRQLVAERLTKVWRPLPLVELHELIAQSTSVADIPEQGSQHFMEKKFHELSLIGLFPWESSKIPWEIFSL